MSNDEFTGQTQAGFLRRLKWRYWDSFRGRLIALSLGLSVTLLWVFVLSSVAILREQYTDVLLEQQFSSVHRLAADLDHKLAERIHLLNQAAAGLPTDVTSASLDRHLRQLRELHHLFSGGIAVVGLDGRTIADFPVAPGRRGTYFGDRDYFTKVVERRQPYIDQPIMGRALKRPVLTISVPVFDNAGKLRAVMTGITDLTARNFLGVVFDQSLSGKGEVFVVSPHDKVIVATGDATRVLGPAPTRGANLMYDRFVAGFEGSGVALSSSGIPTLYSAKRVPTADWLVLAGLPAEVAYKPVTTMRSYLLSLAIVLTLLAVALAKWVTRRMIVPLHEAGRAMRDITRGKAPLAPIPVKTRDEIGGLINNFNLMVADRHRDEAALADSERRLRTLVENAPDAIAVETRGCFAYVNAAALKLFGADSKEKLLGQPIISRIPPKLHDAVTARLQMLNEDRENAPPVAQKMLRFDGTTVYAEISAVPYFYENENGALIFARDITERKRAEDALKESEDRFHHLVEVSTEWYWEVDENFRFTRIVGWGEVDSIVPDDMLGKTPWEILSVAHESLWAEHRALLDRRRPFMDFEFMVRGQDGSIVWHSGSGGPVISGNGVFKGYRGTGKNITERKRAEEELRQSRARIRELAAHQEDIKEAERKRIARDLHDDLGQTLLTMRFDAQQLAQRTAELSKDVHDEANFVLTNINAAMKSVKAIISDLRPSALDLGLMAALEWQVQEFRRRSCMKCELEVNRDDFDCDLDETSAAALFRIVQESLTNILRHAKASCVHIAVRAESDQLVISVTDDGVGISADNRRKKNSFGLLGIEERISALGGTLIIDSAPGKGTKLILSVPTQGKRGMASPCSSVEDRMRATGDEFAGTPQA